MVAGVAIVIGTFGDSSWLETAKLAVVSAQAQTAEAAVIHRHGTTLQDARNGGAGQTDAEWLIFLDADDALDERYVESMLRGTTDVRRPSLLGVTDGVEDSEPVLLPELPLLLHNYIPVGAMVRHDLFDAVGGFRDLPALEDWDLWVRLSFLGASIGACPAAVYKVRIRTDSRNQNVEVHHRVYAQLREEYDAMAKGG